MLNNKVCFITGSTRGIGWSIAKLFATNGGVIIINGRDEEKLTANLDELNQINPKDHSKIKADISISKDIKETYRFIYSKYKRLDVLVNNAGILTDALIGMTTEKMVDELIATNQKAVLFNIQYAIKLMQRQKRGSIINITSIIGKRGNVGQVAYGSTKSAVIGITYSSAKELASHNIRVNAIAPGLIDTNMIKNLSKDKLNDLRNSILMDRIGKPEDVAKVALFFASDLSEYVTGQVLGVDGGMII